MMLESDGNNEEQLIEYAGIRSFLSGVLTDAVTSPRISASWLEHTEGAALVMSLIWLTTETGMGTSHRAAAKVSFLIVT